MHDGIFFLTRILLLFFPFHSIRFFSLFHSIPFEMDEATIRDTNKQTNKQNSFFIHRFNWCVCLCVYGFVCLSVCLLVWIHACHWLPPPHPIEHSVPDVYKSTSSSIVDHEHASLIHGLFLCILLPIHLPIAALDHNSKQRRFHFNGIWTIPLTGIRYD